VSALDGVLPVWSDVRRRSGRELTVVLSETGPPEKRYETAAYLPGSLVLARATHSVRADRGAWRLAFPARPQAGPAFGRARLAHGSLRSPFAV